jgi:hypothetical protein
MLGSPTAHRLTPVPQTGVSGLQPRGHRLQPVPSPRRRASEWRKPPGLRAARVDSWTANSTSPAAYATADWRGLLGAGAGYRSI